MIAVVAVLVEDHDDRAHLAVNLLELAHVRSRPSCQLRMVSRMIDAVENRSGERLDRASLFGENALALLLQKAAVVFDHQVLRRIGADARAVQLAGPFAGELFLLARLQAAGPEPLLRARAAGGAGGYGLVFSQTSSPEILTVCKIGSVVCWRE